MDTIRIGKTIIGDDKNFLFEQPKNQTLWSTASFSTYYYLMTDTTTGVQSMLYCLNFYMDKDYTYYRRWYMKISEALAIISTFIKITDVLFKAIATFFNNFFLFDNLISFLFINYNKKLFQQQNKSTKTLITAKDLRDSITNNCFLKSSMKLSLAITVTNSPLPNHKRFKYHKSFNIKNLDRDKNLFGVVNVLKHFLCCYKKNKIIDIAINRLNMYRDYLFFIKNFREIKILKSIFLCHQQLLCFDYLGKEELSNEYQTDEERSNELHEYLSNTVSKINPINIKLFDFLSSQVKNAEGIA